MTTITIKIDEVKRAKIKQILRNKGLKPNTENVVDYAMTLTIEAHECFDEETLGIIDRK